MKNIDWLYFRKGCTSCKKAQKFFEQHSIAIVEQRDARKEPCTAQDAWGLLSQGDRVVAVKGKTVQNLQVSEKNREAILKMAIGPSGNLRAPTFKIGKYYVVGFNDEMYLERLYE